MCISIIFSLLLNVFDTIVDDLFQGKSEVVYLMDHLDDNKSKDLDRKEILKSPDIFLASQLSYNGQLYIDHEFRKKVFVFMRDLDENNGELV